MKKFFSLVFVVFLIVPVGLWLVGFMRGNGDNTVRHGFPLPETALWLDRGYYQAVEGWFQESLPVGNQLKIINNWLNYHLFAATSTPSIHIGIHGWLYPAPTSPGHRDPTAARQTGQRLFLELHAVENIITATGHQFVFTVVPGKAAIYPEYLGAGGTGTHSPVYRTLVDAQHRYPLAGFIELAPELKKAKLSGVHVYGQHARLWSCKGAAAAARQLLPDHRPTRPAGTDPATIDCPSPGNDLYRLLLGQAPQTRRPMASHTSGPYAVEGPLALIYGDDYLDQLLPYISHAFNGLEIIHSDQESTFGQKMNTADTDVIILETGENGLQRLHLDLASLYAAAEQQMQGVVKREIALDGAKALSQCALDITTDGLQIRSAGSQAFFSLPPTSGSTNSVFRMIQLTFSPAHQGRISVRTSHDEAGWIQKTLSRENRYLIVPLPFGKPVNLQVKPSTHPGVFTLEKAELLSFYGKRPLPVSATVETGADDGDIYSGIKIEPIESPARAPTVEPPAQAALHPMDALPEITLADIQEGRIFQRRGKDADIVVTGTYTGVTGPVEARVVADGSATVVVPWTVVDGSPENGLFTGILSNVPQGGWYQLQVRSSITRWGVVKGGNRWGVGMLVACIGQSNMREWFYTGQDHRPSPDVMFHRNGVWHEPGKSGNGALALGNRLAAALKIPVGLLDYSVNGTGLTAKAEWGKGFWLDTDPEGIYRRLIDGVDATGGSVEYVLWMQGEADAARGTVSREEYRQALERFVSDQIRSDIKNGSSRSRLPFLVIPLVKRPSGRDLPCQWIRDAQMDALETIRECHLATQSIDLENRGRQHLAPASYTTLGVRTAQTILYLLGKMPYHRGPAITGVSRISAREIDVAIAHRGGTDFSPWTEITGFEVFSGEQPLAVAAVRRIDGVTIRIELESDTDEKVRVQYLYGAHPDTSNPVRDNSDLRLPLEPYYR